MSHETRVNLIDLGSEALADALLELANSTQEAENLIDRLLSTPDSAAEKFKKELSSIKRSRKFHDWRSAHDYARRLHRMLCDVEHAVDDPEVGLDLVVRFFGAAERIFTNADDSDGTIGDVFRIAATELFAHFAADIENKECVEEIVIDLLSDNGFGECDYILFDAPDYLNQSEMRSLLKRFTDKSEKESDKMQRRRYLSAIETLASLLGDPKTFAEARIASWGDETNPAACIDIANEYSKTGDHKSALEWLDKIEDIASFQARDRDRQLIRIYNETGEKEKLEELVWVEFRRGRTVSGLDKLLEYLEEDRAAIINQEKELILSESRFSYSNAFFLSDCDETEALEEYVLKYESEVDGDYYENVAKLAKSLEKADRVHGATIAYRALLDSILRKGRTKAYYYGVRYLKKLEKLALVIDNWRGIENHEVYFESIRRDHGRKRSFWSKYEA